MANTNNIHIGEEVKKVFKASGLTPDEFASRLNLTRTAIYAIFKNPTIKFEQLQRISEALEHDFMYLLGVDKEEPETVSDIKEHIPSMHFHTDAVDDKTFANIVSDYVSGNFVKPLVVMAYDCGDEARRIAYNASHKIHGALVSRNATDLQSLKYTPHKVYIFSEKNLKEKVEDVDVYLGKIIETNSKAGKYVIYIIDIPRYDQDSIEDHNKLEEILRQKHLLWGRSAHTLCFDHTQALYNRRKQLRVINGCGFDFDASISACLARLTDEEKQLIASDPYNIIYSEDGKRLIKAASASGVYEVKEGTEIICSGAFEDNDQIKKVILPQSVRIIGTSAFRGCKELLQIGLPETMDSICDGCFCNCEKLSKVVMPKDLKYICGYAFNNCSSLNNIDIPPTLTTIGSFAFTNSGLTTVTISKEGLDICTVKNEAFSDCKQLKSVTIGDFVNIEGVNVFSDCVSLTDITLQGRRPNAGELIGGLSAICPSLEHITYNLV